MICMRAERRVDTRAGRRRDMGVVEVAGVIGGKGVIKKRKRMMIKMTKTRTRRFMIMMPIRMMTMMTKR